ncbi:hypothetical protein K438DRAFT_1929795 [Mycena galopus ATCC 62051]|nr:hypothetical protein K438DRAFT_1929795 [Mycena galopus ATCC 62051]
MQPTMNPLRAFGYILVFLLCSWVTVWCSRSVPSDATLRWIMLELRPALALTWLTVAMFLCTTLIHLALSSRPGEITLAERPEVPPESGMSLGAYALLFSLLVNASTAAFMLFRFGVPWSQTGVASDNIIAFMAFSFHGFVNCLGAGVLLYALHYIPALCRGPAISETDDAIDNLEKGVHET